MKDYDYSFIPADAYTDADRDADYRLVAVGLARPQPGVLRGEKWARIAEISGELPAGYPVFREKDAAVAAALIFPREIHTPRGSLTLMALSGVCVRSDLRGQGMGAGWYERPSPLSARVCTG